ncbi:unnamed protein product [Rotaria sp. Silwood1]|nr:unnamed protein product [Rotaria sp. Silwood1]CAF4799680.1 unnamed protein product [Rotaria sp. Silwood1]CAF4806119.1 unnamed protein product [Rotaria sp. Silwood1]
MSTYTYIGLAVLINRINKSNITVGVDGSLYRYHPRFKRNMEKCMKILVNKNIKFELQLSNDGSGVGAALTVAAEVLSTQSSKESTDNQKPKQRRRSHFLPNNGSGKEVALIAIVTNHFYKQKEKYLNQFQVWMIIM